uniref:CFA20 domain-containing protein n=1 Tax=Tetraselmis sp. GSL018 TaxID=582737 RepID=A0A061QI10_9CHLO
MALFSSDYQGGPYFDVFGPQGSSPLSKWKISGPGSKSVKKVYEKDVKGYVFNCPGGHGFKMGFPKDERKAMCLLQPFLGLQLNISSGEQFSVELSLTAGDGSRRRLFLSSSFQELKATALHAQVPLQGLKWGCWTNLVLNVFSIAEACFPGRSFRSIDHITLGGCFKLRKVFTLKQAPPDTVLQRQAMAAVPIPAVLDFPIGIVCDTQVVDSFFLSAARASAAERRNPQLGGRAEAAEPVSPIKLGVQGEAAGTPAAARSCARQPAPRLYRGGCNTGQEESRIPGPPPSSGQRWAHRQYQREPPKPPEPEDDCAARDDARRAQSAAVQRQAAEATGSVASDEIGPVAEPPGRKVVSAAGGAAAGQAGRQQQLPAGADLPWRGGRHVAPAGLPLPPAARAAAGVGCCQRRSLALVPAVRGGHTTLRPMEEDRTLVLQPVGIGDAAGRGGCWRRRRRRLCSRPGGGACLGRCCLRHRRHAPGGAPGALRRTGTVATGSLPGGGHSFVSPRRQHAAERVSGPSSACEGPAPRASRGLWREARQALARLSGGRRPPWRLG